jgi:hypothetical protein
MGFWAMPWGADRCQHKMPGKRLTHLADFADCNDNAGGADFGCCRLWNVNVRRLLDCVSEAGRWGQTLGSHPPLFAL